MTAEIKPNQMWIRNMLMNQNYCTIHFTIHLHSSAVDIMLDDTLSTTIPGRPSTTNLSVAASVLGQRPMNQTPKFSYDNLFSFCHRCGIKYLHFSLH
mmetsp:Transcript_17929/g.33417  ORF Transcript_17929/g.33417 Transcript_17929/m.33417 type:complete len:97 (+) Transcript_17929:207-497(+)